MSETYKLSLTRTIAAPCEAVFEAWLSPEALKHFMCPAEGITVPRAKVDSQEGGKFLIVMQAGNRELPHRHEYQAIDKYRNLASTGISDHTADTSLVTITFKPLGTG